MASEKEIPLLDMVEVSNLSITEIQYVRACVLDHPVGCTDHIYLSEFLVIALYDLIKARGYDAAAVSMMLKHFKEPLMDASLEMASARPGDKIKLRSFHLADGKYVAMDGVEGVLNVKTMETLPQCPAPMLTELVVLPELYRRVVEALKRLSDQRSRASTPTAG